MIKASYRRKSLIEVPEVKEYILMRNIAENGRHGCQRRNWEFTSLSHAGNKSNQKASKL